MANHTISIMAGLPDSTSTKTTLISIWDGLSNEDRSALEKQGYKTGSVSFQIQYTQEVPVAIIKRLVQAQAALNQAKKGGRK